MSRSCPFGCFFFLVFFWYVRATRTRTSGRDALLCVHLCARFCTCRAVSVQHDLHTFWRFAGAFSKMPSVSAAIWARCIHSSVGGSTQVAVHVHAVRAPDSEGRHGFCGSKLYFLCDNRYMAAMAHPVMDHYRLTGGSSEFEPTRVHFG